MKLYPTAYDLSNLVIGRLTVKELVARGRRGNLWRCECTCGNTEYRAFVGDLRSGRISSCGCYRDSQEFADTKVIHGQRRQNKGETSGAYKSWAEMKRRCDDPERQNFPYYGGKGITYDFSWKDFSNFYADMGDRPEGLELDRKDNSKGYSKENCRWVTHKENCNNRGMK